ncbi:MAG TPA: hypothetical protein VH054_15640 [Polyangiaceae bacterium]|jgi:hypothetical protein|nr:hypothetical protein [Polyangiaceae bacterium]
MRIWIVLGLVLVLACGGAAFTPDPPGAFDPSGVKLVIGVERQKTFVVHRDGEVVSSETGNSAMKFVGSELRTIDGTKTLIAVVGDELRAGDKHVGSFEGDALALGDVRLLVTDDGQVEIERHSETRKMRMHFEGNIVGHRRPALMLVAFVFAVYAATNPHASIEQFTD